jgi:hypothetical protein
MTNNISPSCIDHLPGHLSKLLEAKQAADLQFFLLSCSIDPWLCHPIQRSHLFWPFNIYICNIWGKKNNENGDDPPPTQADFAKMLDCHKKLSKTNLLSAFNMLTSRFNKLEGKNVHDLDPFNVDRLRLLSNLNKGCHVTSMPTRTYMHLLIKPNWYLWHYKPRTIVSKTLLHNTSTRVNDGPIAPQPLVAHNTVLPNPPKSTSAIPMLSGATNLPQTDISESLN